MQLPDAGTIEISPSILAADFSRLGSEIAEVEAAGVKMVHLDVMDGHFVPNITIGPSVVASIRKCTGLVLDTHLMISDPETYAEKFVAAGSDHITFHIETVDKPLDLVKKLHDLGVSVGITLNPETDVESVLDIAPHCEMVLVMTVHPGFGGQDFIDEAARKCVKIRKCVGDGVRIEVDGGIGPDTVGAVVGYGADTLVAGHAIFSHSDRAGAIEAIRAGAKKS